MSDIREICIYGLGGVGGYFGGQMAGAAERGQTPGQRVSFIARGEHLKAISAAGLTIEAPDKAAITARPAFAAASLAEVPAPDVLFLCVKSYHLPSALESIRPYVRPDTAVIPLLNGFDIYHRVRAVLTAPVVLPACCYVTAKIERPGVIWQDGERSRIIAGREQARGDYDGAALRDYMRAVVSATELEFDWNEDPWPKIWTKYLFIAGINLVNTDYKLVKERQLSETALRERYRQVIGEMADIAGRMGAELPDSTVDDAVRRCLRYPNHQNSSFQRDLLETGKSTETELFGPALIQKGRELGVAIPGIEETVASIAARFPQTR
jgi:2-dehydropantoate 2-reductase